MTMPAMLTELYDALRRANVPEAAARAAAQAVMVGGMERQFADVNKRLDDIRAQFIPLREQLGFVGARLSGIEERLEPLDQRLTRIDATLRDQGEQLAEIRPTLTHHWWLSGAVFVMLLGAIVTAVIKTFWG